ncbi:hypothetical protein GGI07_003979 [Coemansia sp. Benny D115]|nr:hypothetical protein GGI07_003979 [Coemansia sp. Benny D115]
MIDHQNVHVIGHSAGAHLATLAVLQGDNAEWISSIKSVLGIGGIYDIPGLLSRYPSYLDFVDMAFTPNQYKDASPVNAAASMAVAQVKNIPFMVVNSTTDELIDAGQAERFARALEQSGFKTELRINSDIGDHYGQLERPEFWRLAVEFVETN